VPSLLSAHLNFVIPVKACPEQSRTAGIQFFFILAATNLTWMPAFAGMTDVYDSAFHAFANGVSTLMLRNFGITFSAKGRMFISSNCCYRRNRHRFTC
jgi:hypothetical protein